MTYREAIQKLKNDIDNIYEAASPMRDCANGQEKKTWNDVRTHTRNAYTALSVLDNQLPDQRAQMELGFDV